MPIPVACPWLCCLLCAVPAGGGMDAADAAGAAVEVQWQELDPELPYNKDRAGVMQQGQLRCYQLGSATLGRTMNEDDAEKGERGKFSSILQQSTCWRLAHKLLDMLYHLGLS
eukprot:GHRQ01036631.1.p3 GENE.GHRQ01036631.1~~GHRQ01036631.1.p3  ORF type:complete len:113 (+),score=37.32 GHRQ01036631.1:708-1046(+)